MVFKIKTQTLKLMNGTQARPHRSRDYSSSKDHIIFLFGLRNLKVRINSLHCKLSIALTVLITFCSSGIHARSRFFAYGMGTSVPVTRKTGESK